ncbi:MAG: flagellin [Deltaproteobacteria bacterium]|nr:flagellin [Deltaproteobacteria bacterium]
MTSDSSSSSRGISKATNNLQDVFAKLASGSRIRKASDDPAGLSVAAQLDAVATTLSQGSRNAADSQSALAIADSAVSQISDIAGRLQELATQAGSGTLSDDQRQTLQAEYGQLTQEIQRISATTEFNGKQLLGGEGVTTQVGTDSSANSQISYGGVDISSLVSSVASGSIATQAGAQQAIDQVNSFISGVASKRGEIGAASSRLEVADNNNQVQRENALAAESRIRDADVADLTAQKVAAQIQLRASTAISAQANQSTAIVRQLLS